MKHLKQHLTILSIAFFVAVISSTLGLIYGFTVFLIAYGLLVTMVVGGLYASYRYESSQRELISDYNAKEITQLNRDQLHEKSKDVYGEAIGFYSKATEIIIKGSKKAGEPFDAYDTGGLLDGLYAKVQNDMIVFGSTDPKVGLILNSDNWLSKDLFGLTDDDLRMIIDTRIRPFIIDYNRKMLGL